MTNKALRDVFIRFRMGISEIKTHKLRYSTDPSDDLSCPLCKCCVDDEIHFLFVCKATEALRSNFFATSILSGLEKTTNHSERH